MRRHWTETEIAVLHALYAETLTPRIAKMIGCTVSEVFTAAKHFGLRKSPAWRKATNAHWKEKMTPYVLNNYIPVPETGCWLWLGVWCPNGYGRISKHGQQIQASRAFYEHFNGAAIPDDMFACHKCDTPACVNPDHIFLGTQKDNMQDASNKGRMQAGAIKGRQTRIRNRLEKLGATP